MSNAQIQTIVLALATSFIAVLTGVLWNNTRLNDVKDSVNGRVDSLKELLEAKMERNQSQLQLLIEKNHSELLLKFSGTDTRLARLENERRIVQ